MRETPQDVGRRLLAAKPHGPEWSYGRLSKRLFADWGIDISDEQLRKYHVGDVSDVARMSVDVVCALARYYGKDVAEISTTIEERRLRVAGLHASYAAWDSNPEPTVSEPSHPLRRAADLVASAA